MAKNILTTKEICNLFGVETMTVYNWRTQAVRKSKLPFHVKSVGKVNRIYFKRGEVKKWAKDNEIEFKQPNLINTSGIDLF